MAYNFIRNAKCLDGFPRTKWSCLGRTGVSQSSVAIDEFGQLFTWGQNYNAQSGQGDICWSGGNSLYPEIEEIEWATQVLPMKGFIKSSSGEGSSVALHKSGDLWGWGDGGGGDCAAFGLPYDSGGCRTCCRGGSEGAGDYHYFRRPVLCTPGWKWKDVAHCYYYTLAIGMDNKLYTFGRNVNEGLGMDLPNNYLQHTPLLNTYLTDDVKLIDCELDANVAVTVDNKVYIWGDSWAWWWPVDTPTELTGLPVGAVVEQISCCYWGVIALLADGTVWAAGDEIMYGDNLVTGNSLTFLQVTSMVPKGTASMVRTTSLGNFSVVIIADGNIWSWGDDIEDYMGNTLPFTWDIPMLCASQFEGEHNFVDAVHNTHNAVFQAIDDQGYLWTWGWQGWGPHLAIGAAYQQYLADQDPEVIDVVNQRTIAGYAAQPRDLQGNFLTHNSLPSIESKYWQGLGQSLRHRPCGHWHLRTFFEEELWPQNCWMPSLAIDDNILLFVACGKWAKELPGSGNEVMMFIYDIDANIWTNIMYESAIHAANAPGGAAIDSDIYAFANWKADQVGQLFQEEWVNYGIGVWVVDSAGVLEYNDFADIDNTASNFMANKVAVYAGGVVAIAYHDNAGQLLVRVSTDYGATWNLRKTVGALAARKDFSLTIDKNTGYIFLAHQVSATSVMVERSIDNGVIWTTRVASNYMTPAMTKIKLVADGTMLFLLCASEAKSVIERSLNEGLSWSSTTFISGEPGASIMASGCNVVDGYNDLAFVLVEGDTVNIRWHVEITYPALIAYWEYALLAGSYAITYFEWFSVYGATYSTEGSYTVHGTMYNYIHTMQVGEYDWFERDLTTLNFGGENIVASVNESESSLEGMGGRFAYASFNFYTGVAPHIAVMITNDRGVTWDARQTPLGYYEDGEFGDFRGCPLFCLKEVPYLNHIWKFEKSNWADSCGGFVKQKDKYVPVLKCSCIKCA